MEGNTASCTGALGLADLEKGDLVWYEDLKDVKWIRWTADNKALVVLLNDGSELMIDLATGATSPTDWMNWTKFFELWALQRRESDIEPYGSGQLMQSAFLKYIIRTCNANLVECQPAGKS